MRYLITPTLLNSFQYYFSLDAEDSEGMSADEKEAKARSEFLSMLAREPFERTKAMQDGIDFENAVRDYCEGHDTEFEAVREIGDIVKGGTWQDRVKKEMGDYLLYGKTDVIKADTIYDIKRTSSYDIGKYQKSAQHRIYLFCTGLPKFSYLPTDSRSVWREDYFAHSEIEREIMDMIRQFTDYLKNDTEASNLFYEKWNAA